MARKKEKTEKQQKDSAVIEAKEQVEVQEQVTEQSETVIVTDKEEKTESPKVDAPKKVNNPKIPDFADRLLKIFSDQAELYITEAGRVFSKDTKPYIRGRAILYKNPYYNN